MDSTTENARSGTGEAARRRRNDDADWGDSGTLASMAYAKLREDILAGVLAPNQRLLIHELRQRYGIGVAPLREALVRLQGEQLVEAEGHRGCWVAPISLDELRELTRVRVILEAEALRGAIARGTDDWEGQVLAAFHRLSRATERGAHLSPETLREWEVVHEQFHCALIAGDGSRLLLRLRTSLTQLVGRYRRYALSAAGDRRHLEEHRAIMTAVLDRDADTAVALLTEHYELTTRAILAKFEGEYLDAR